MDIPERREVEVADEDGFRDELEGTEVEEGSRLEISREEDDDDEAVLRVPATETVESPCSPCEETMTDGMDGNASSTSPVAVLCDSSAFPFPFSLLSRLFSFSFSASRNIAPCFGTGWVVVCLNFHRTPNSP